MHFDRGSIFPEPFLLFWKRFVPGLTRASCVGYTPLHMAVGYSHVAAVAALLEAGADPEVQDRQSRDVIALVESIREKMPIAPEYMGRRVALEQVTALLAGTSPPANVLLNTMARTFHTAVLARRSSPSLT